MEAKSTGDLSSLAEEQRLRKTDDDDEVEERPMLPATEPPERKNFRTDMGSSAPPGGGHNPYHRFSQPASQAGNDLGAGWPLLEYSFVSVPPLSNIRWDNEAQLFFSVGGKPKKYSNVDHFYRLVNDIADIQG